MADSPRRTCEARTVNPGHAVTYHNELSVRAEFSLDMARKDSVNDLLDAIAIPAGRDVAKAWERACLLFGRSNYELPVSLGGKGGVR